MPAIVVPNGDAPVGYTLPGNQSGMPLAISAIFDGTGAGASFVPTVSFYDQSGLLLARQFAEEQASADVSEVTFAPFLRKTT